MTDLPDDKINTQIFDPRTGLPGYLGNQTKRRLMADVWLGEWEIASVRLRCFVVLL
jgi:hypothetical protein